MALTIFLSICLLHTQLQGKGSGEQSTKSLIFSVNSNSIDDLSQFGTNIASMCKGLPTYLAVEVPGEYLAIVHSALEL
jgi:hypothetical protein